MITIAVDGPAGAGKSTAAKAVAARLGLLYLDTGAMYRSIGLKAMRLGIPYDDESAIMEMMADTDLDVEYIDGVQHFFVDGEDVTEKIRTPECGMAASAVSALVGVRKRLVAMQQAIAGEKNVIMDGRDIGTVVLPDAKYKFYVTASSGVRAVRRYEELKAKGDLTKTLDEIEQEIIKRDYDDSHREHSPLRQAEDALLLDTSEMTLEEVINEMIRVVEEGEAN